jgi:serpin B
VLGIDIIDYLCENRMTMGVKSFYIVLVVTLLALCCDKKHEVVMLEDVFSIEQPKPEKAVTRVALDERQKGYVKEGNKLSFRVLQQLSKENGKSFVCSPLSLQLALAMTANGAQEETLQEMLNVLGYGQDGMAAMNAYARILIEQLPAVDLDVTLKMADALLASDRYPLKAGFQETLRKFYYAPAASMPFSDKAKVLAQVNEWARKNTGGLIDPMLDDLDPNAAALLMNALYFKAKWQGSEMDPMFDSKATAGGPFIKADGSMTKVPFMSSYRNFPYADMGDYEVAALPYASGKFFFYILLPKAKDGLAALVESLPGISWNNVISSLQTDAEVRLKMPKFDVSGDFLLNDALKALGMRRAFDEVYAQFDGMFDGSTPGFYISRVLQKAKMTVAEWGTEAAAVTVVEMAEKSSLPGKVVRFEADHPFVFVLGEQESGTILFEGVYTGE